MVCVMELTEMQVISNVIAAFTLTYSGIEKRAIPWKHTTETRRLFLQLNFGVDLTYYMPYYISFRIPYNSVCYNRSVLLRIFRKSNSSLGASDSMNNTLSRM